MTRIQKEQRIKEIKKEIETQKWLLNTKKDILDKYNNLVEMLKIEDKIWAVNSPHNITTLKHQSNTYFKKLELPIKRKDQPEIKRLMLIDWKEDKLEKNTHLKAFFQKLKKVKELQSKLEGNQQKLKELRNLKTPY